MRKRLFCSLLVLAGLIMAIGLLLWIAPECLILKYTGCYCAGCGTQHMVLALLRGDFSGAVRENVFMIIALPVAAVYFLWEAVRYVQGKPALWRRKGFFAALGIVLAAAAVFTVLRNIPGSWLAPAWAVG